MKMFSQIIIIIHQPEDEHTKTKWKTEKKKK